MSDRKLMLEDPAAYYMQVGAEQERERIIKLLENEKFILPEGIDEGLTLMPIQEAIALIKGELS